MFINNHNIYIKVNKEIIEIRINNDSNISMLFLLVKNFINWYEFLPESIYTIYAKNKIIIKSKKSMHYLRNITYWEFMDFKENENSIALASSNNETLEILGWEIRFKIDISNDVNLKIKIIEKEIEGLNFKLINNND